MAAHSMMQLEIRDIHKNELSYWLFRGVYYFEGPIAWKGPMIVCASDTEALSFMRTLKMFEDMTVDELLHSSVSYKMFIADGEKLHVKIIATDGGLVNTIPLNT
jgi:hypothetical protein